MEFIRTKHFDTCSAPICNEWDYTGIVWYPGEEVCKSRPMTQLQKVQRRINKFMERGVFENPYDYFYGEELMARTRVSASSSGHKDPATTRTRHIPAKKG